MLRQRQRPEKYWKFTAYVLVLMGVFVLGYYLGSIQSSGVIVVDSGSSKATRVVTSRPTLLATLTLTPADPLQPEDPPAPTTTVTPRATPLVWQTLPIIPAVSEKARQVYQLGQAMGNNPRSFSKVGDCESRTTWFLSDFDLGPKYYSLGDYANLQPVINNFAGSFGWLSQVAKPGFNAASVITPLWADPQKCLKDETPLACEYRLKKPSFAFILLGTNDVAKQETFETNMRKIIEYTLQQGIVPILATKADNYEGDNSINRTIARLALAYDVPLWNFWAAVQSLPNHGLQPDGTHLTWAPNRFDDPAAMKNAWPVRNLNALQVLDAVWHGVTR
jgi:hypothetical protein